MGGNGVANPEEAQKRDRETIALGKANEVWAAREWMLTGAKFEGLPNIRQVGFLE